MKQLQKSKAAILLGMGVMIAATFLNAAHPVRVKPAKTAVEISANISTADDWDSPSVNSDAR